MLSSQTNSTDDDVHSTEKPMQPIESNYHSPPNRIPVLTTYRNEYKNQTKTNQKKANNQHQNLNKNKKIIDYYDSVQNKHPMINTNDSETPHLSQTGCEEPVFESAVRRRTIRYYIGNIGPSSNRAGLLQFLKEHGVVPIGVRMIETHRGHLSATITVNASDRYTVEYDIPWPKKMHCRRWLGKQQWSSRSDHTDYYDENDYYCNENEGVD